MVNMDTSQENKVSPSNKVVSPSNKKHAGRAGKVKAGRFYCSTCDVHCPNEATLQQHNTGKKHVANVSNTQRRDKHALSSVFVGNLPKLAHIRARLAEEGAGSCTDENEKLKSDLMTRFSEYGDISKIIIDKKHGSYSIIEYRTPSMAQIVLSEYQAGKLLPFYGKKLQIKSRSITEVKPLHDIVAVSEIDKDNIIALLEESADDSECALNMMDAAICLQDKSRRRRSEAVVRLQDQLNTHLPFHKITLSVYGSEATGLALRDSDVDVSLKAGTRLERDDLVSVLKAKCTGVSHVHVIPAPGQGTITRFLDGISNTMFDVLFSNRLGEANTALINTILSYECKIARFIRLVVYWRRCVLGRRFSKQSLPSSYSITIMCLHYLRVKGIIPDFLDTSLITQHTQVYDLDCSFVSDLTKLPTPVQCTVPDLLTGFWRYYGKEFDSEDHVVSLRPGTLLKSDLETEARIEGEHRYVTAFKPSPLAVQDPFVLTHNLSHNVTLECLVLFRDCCRSAIVNWSKPRPLHAWLLGDTSTSPAQHTVSMGVDEDAVSMGEDDDDGDKTPVWEEGESVITGSKRSADAMEH